jgi:hypothetical protein
MAQTAFYGMMDPKMRGFWEITDSNEIISDLNEILEPEICLMRHERLDEFLSCKMKEHDYVGLHLAKMHMIHKRLPVELEYKMMDDLTKSVVLCSLPPSYRSFVKRFVKEMNQSTLISSWQESGFMRLSPLRL